MNLAVHATILAVDVVEQSWGQHHVVESCIEDFLLFAIGGCDSNTRKLPLPGVTRREPDMIKIPTGDLGLQILQCRFRAYAGETGFDNDDLSGLCLITNYAFKTPSLGFFGPREQFSVVREDYEFPERLGELHRKVDFAPTSPSRRASFSKNRIVLSGFQLSR